MSTTYDDPITTPERTRPQARLVERTWPLVAAREIRVKLTDRNFLVTTGVTLVLLIWGSACRPFSPRSISAPQYRVATAPATSAAAAAAEAAEAERLVAQAEEVLDAQNRGRHHRGRAGRRPGRGSRRWSKNGDADALLLGDAATGWRLAAEGDLAGDLQQAIETAVRTAR